MRKLGIVLLTAFLFASAACGDLESPEDLRQRAEELVFGEKRDVEQVRGQIERARMESDKGNRRGNRQERLMRVAQAARGTGKVRAVYRLPNRDCTNDDGTAVGYGSGMLTSDSRFVTAHHAVPKLSEEAEKPLVVSFGGEYRVPESDVEDLSAHEMAGNFVDDHPSSGNNYSGGDHVKDAKSALQHENPLLANRLFALGLRRWAKRNDSGGGRAKRNRIRKHWPFEVDAIRPTQESDLVWNGIDIDGDGEDETGLLDVIVLKAKEHEEVTMYGDDDGSINYLPSGPFTLNRPAVFFMKRQYVDVTSENSSFSPPTDQDPLYLSHYNTWPNDNQETFIRHLPLVSNPGYSDGTYPWEVGGTPHSWVPDEGICSSDGSEGVLIVPTYSGFIGTTLDAHTGSSGGAALSVQRYDSSRVTDRPMAFGVLSGFRADNDDQYKSWGDPVQPWSDGTEEQDGGPTDDLATFVTAATDKVQKWSRRGFDLSVTGTGDPFNPGPDQPDPSGQLDCAEWDTSTEDEVCLRYETKSPGNPVWEDKPEGVPVKPNDEPDDPDCCDDPDHEVRTRICGHALGDETNNWEHPAGSVVGFTGGVTAPLDEEGEGVGNFRAICAPWSDRAHTDHWRWLRSNVGRWVYQGVDSWMDKPRSSFPDTLRDEAEYRTPPGGGKEQLRPVSFKTCPPNYYVQEIEVLYDENDLNERGEPKFVGLRAMECVPPPNNPDAGEDNLLVYLDANVAATAMNNNNLAGNFEGFKSFKADSASSARPFTLHQFIGNPGVQGTKDTGVDPAILSCDGVWGSNNTSVVAGLTYDGSHDGAMHDLHLECQPLPK